MLGDFTALLRAFVRAATVVDGLEGYPIFLSPRSMAQVEFVGTLERLAGGWCNGTQPHSRGRGNNNPPNGKLAIEAPPERTSSPLALSSPPLSRVRSSKRFSSKHLGHFSTHSRHRHLHLPHILLWLWYPPHRRSLPPPSFTAISTLASHSIARVSYSHPSRSASAPRGAECARGAEAHVFAFAGLDLGKGKAKPLPINIPLHGPRVEVVLVWLAAAVWLIELESVALSESSDGC